MGRGDLRQIWTARARYWEDLRRRIHGRDTDDLPCAIEVRPRVGCGIEGRLRGGCDRGRDAPLKEGRGWGMALIGAPLKESRGRPQAGGGLGRGPRAGCGGGVRQRQNVHHCGREGLQ
jgi:hypothetical protein